MGIFRGPDNFSSGLISNVILKNTTRHWKETNLSYDLGIWSSGSLPGTPFNRVSASLQQNIADVQGPYYPQLSTQPVWSTSGSSAGTGTGGIYCSTIPIQNGRRYRMSYWEKRINNGSATYGRHYFGLNGYGSTNGVQYIAGSNPITNPYFWARSHPSVPFDWTLLIGIVEPWFYSGSADSDNGAWKLDGTKLTNNDHNYKWLAETTSARPRSLTLYHANDANMLHYSCCPKIEMLDGTEPSVDDLIHGRTMKIRDAKNGEYVYLTEFNNQSNSTPAPNNTTSLSLDFDITKLPTYSPNTFSFSFWLWYSNGAAPLIQRDGNVDYNIQIEINSTDNIIIKQRNSSSFTRGTLINNSWQMITLTMNNNVGELYINAISQSSTFTFTNNFDNSGEIRIGRSRYNWSTNIPGNLYNDIRIYDTVLSNEQIDLLYSATKHLYI